MSSRINWDILTMYVFGECSVEQRKEVERWLAEDPVRKGTLDDLRAVHDSTGKTPNERADDERRQARTWAQVRAHMQQETGGGLQEEEGAASRAPSSPSRPATVRRAARHERRSAPRTAAILAAVALLTVLAWQLWSVEPAPEIKAFVTQRGERATIRLADSTHVHLNADSRLELLPGFEAGARKVRLRGQAYFEVAPNARRPFLVYAGPATTEVLGTKFDVNAYAGAAEVVVAEGKVAVRSGAPLSQKETVQNEASNKKAKVLQESARGEVMLTSKQAARLGPNKELGVREVNLDRHLAWLRGELVFEDAAFVEVARQLERRYDVDVEMLLDGQAVRGQLTARFSEEQPLGKVLTVVASVFDLKYEQEEDLVTFSP